MSIETVLIAEPGSSEICDDVIEASRNNYTTEYIAPLPVKENTRDRRKAPPKAKPAQATASAAFPGDIASS